MDIEILLGLGCKLRLDKLKRQAIDLAEVEEIASPTIRPPLSSLMAGRSVFAEQMELLYYSV
jgi:hypothetical protein